MTVLGWLLPGLPGVAGALLAITRVNRLAPFIAIAVAVLTLGLAVAATVTRPAVRAPLFEGLPMRMAVDGLSAVLVLTVAVVTLAVLVYAAGERVAPESRFSGLMLLFAGAMLVTVTARDLATLLMSWEVMGATSYALIGFWWHEPERVRSANIAFVTTRAGDLGLYLAAGAALAGGHSLALAGHSAASGAGPLALDGLAGNGWRNVVAAGIVAAALGKSAQLPFSFWLSKAMAGPSPVSALLHSATMVAAGAYLLLRVEPLLAATGWAATLVTWVGALTALLLGAVALAQRDLKQLLAASTCAQLGFMVMAAGIGSVAGGTAQLVAHAAAKSLLFLVAGIWLSALGTKDLAGLRGAARRYPLVGAVFTVGALALAGLPPLSLWVTKDAVLGAADPALYAVGLAAGTLSAGYAIKALIAVWHPDAPTAVRPADPPPARQADPSATPRSAETPAVGVGEPSVTSLGRVTMLQKLPLPVLAFVAATFGGVGLPPVWRAWRDLLGAPHEAGPGVAELVVSGALAVVGAVTLHRVHARPLTRWLYLDRITSVAVLVLALARALARFDDRVIDGGVRAAAAGGRFVARSATRRVEIRVDGIVNGVGRGTRVLGALARRPQTGQVHTYYAQAAVLLLVLVLVVVLIR